MTFPSAQHYGAAEQAAPPDFQALLVIPTYNERETLPALVEALFALPVRPSFHILVVDDNSPDGTGRWAAQAAAGPYAGRLYLLTRPTKSGLGRAYLAGFAWALKRGYAIIGQMDADFSHQPRYLPAMFRALHEADLVVGSRYIAGGGVERTWPLRRKWLSRWGNFYARHILGLSVRDVTGGFRLWRADLLRKLPLQRVTAVGYAFQIELMYLAFRAGARIREVPIYFPDRRGGHSKMSLSIQLEAAWRVWWMRWHYRDWPERKAEHSTR